MTQKNPIDDRLDRLEELLAHQAKTLDDIGDELLRANNAYDRLERRHKALLARLQILEESAAGGTPGRAPEGEKPPHY